MSSESTIPPQDNLASPQVPAAVPPVFSDPPPHSATMRGPSSSIRQLLAILLSLCLGLFLIDGLVSLADDSLILFFHAHVLAVIRGLLFFVVLLATVMVYILMGITPLVPKRLFLPLTLFAPLAMLITLQVQIYHPERIQQAAWLMSLTEVIVGILILRGAQGGWRLRWPLLAVNRLGIRGFSWLNLVAFVGLNVFVLVPLVIGYVVVSASVALNHFSDGFVTLRRVGLTVQARKYVRDDGKTVELMPMAHVADARFYREIAQSFPTNAIILMEGVTDEQNLITNQVTYERMAASLGVAEQHESFQPQGELVRADVDVAEFAPSTIDMLNMIMLLHAKGLTVENVFKLMQYSPPPKFETQLWEDLLEKRNRHVLHEMNARLPQSENFIVPWGAAHMPGLAREIQKSGFRLTETRNYVVIRFGSRAKANAGTRKDSP